MAAPTEDEIQAQINRLILMLDEGDKWNTSATKNVLAMYDAVVEGFKGEFAALAIQGADAFRATSSALVSPAIGTQMLNAAWRQYGKQQGFPERNPVQILDRLLVYFAEGSERVTPRTFTFGAPAAITGTGDGVVNRITKDRYDFDIEAATPEAKEIKCIADQSSGGAQIGQQTFEIRGAHVPRDFVEGVVGFDRAGTITAISSDDAARFLTNPSFNQFTGTAPDITTVTGWTIATIADVQIEDTDGVSTIYRTSIQEGTAPGSLRFQDNEKITQLLDREQFDPFTPYYCQIAFFREASCDGNLTIRLGATTATVALSAQSGWTILRIALDQGLYLRNFNASVLDFEVELDSRTTGTLLVDDIVLAPATRFDGTWWAIVGGATEFLLEDLTTATDTVSEAIINKWLWRLYNRYLPHGTTAQVTWAEPA